MKIISLKSLNVNSLKGKTEVDFVTLTKTDALFAITGATGSGKSTLLDIISCALYGRTARLKNPSDLMSRHCGETYCEVEFEIRGKQYRSSWSQKRARNKHDGKLQPHKMELVDLGKDKILELKSKEVPKKIEELSGLDFNRFTQSMMLAQGGFDAFLKADEKERSALLQKITGTQIYADISIAIFDKHRSLATQMATDMKILESIEVLDDKVVKQMQEKLLESKTQKKQTDTQLTELFLALNWIQTLSKLTQESKINDEKFVDATASKEKHKESFVKLSLAKKALNISPISTSYTQLQKNHLEDKTTLAKLDEELEILAKGIEQKSKEYQKEVKEFEDARSEFEVQKVKLKKVREIQTQEKETQKEILKTQLYLEDKKTELEQTGGSLDAILESLKSIEMQIDDKNSYLKKHFNDEKLLSTLGGTKQNKANFHQEKKSFISYQKELEHLASLSLDEQKKYDILLEKVVKLTMVYQDKELAYKKLDKVSVSDTDADESMQKRLKEIEEILRTLQSRTKTTKKRDEELGDVEKNIAKEKTLSDKQNMMQEHIDAIKKHIDTLRDKRDKEQLLKKYKEDRAMLVAGDECFLCGSKEHPYRDELAEISVDATQMMMVSELEQLKEKESELKSIESQLTTAQTRIQGSELEVEKLDIEIITLHHIFEKYSFELSYESELNLKEEQERVTKELDELKLRHTKKSKLLKQRDEAREHLRAEEKVSNEHKLTIQNYTTKKEQLVISEKQSKIKLDAYTKSLKSYFKEFSITLEMLDVDARYLELKNRDETYTKTLIDIKTLESKLNIYELDKKESQTKKSSIDAEIATMEVNLKVLKSSKEKLGSNRMEIVAVDDLNSYEKEVTKKYEDIQKKEQLAKENLTKLKTKDESYLAQKNDLDMKIGRDESELNQLTIKLEKLYEEYDFKDADEFKDASMANDEREELDRCSKDIEDIYSQTKILKNQTDKKLKQHKQEGKSEKSLEELGVIQALLQQKSDALGESIGSDKKELELNKEDSQKYQKIEKSLEIKTESFKVWVKLNELVGSADGTKFKKFAQGITLDQLINLANRHLSILNTRYTLLRSQEKLLELEVVDAYQGDTVRPVSTLSGGESFIVSLALALGLSELASQKIAIDSLFLDEGFGTLDEDSLETALNALSLLQNSGKMIGVISHVEALKERIPLQIRVVSNGDGTSFIEI